MRPSFRIALFLLSLALMVSTATPAVGHDGHAGRDANYIDVAEVVESEPGVRARQVDARLIEEYHEGHGHDRWARGRGHWGHSWSTYKVQSRKLRSFLLSRSESVRRFALVVRWSRVAACESSGNWAIDTGNGYLGGLQFTMGTWRAYGGQGLPHQQPAWYQAQIADNVRIRSGLQHWPVCGRLYG